VVRNGKRIALTATEFALLELLMRNKNQVLPRQYISEAVWGIGFDRRTNLVDVYINYLRHKIDAGSDERLIHTVVGKGYMLREAPLS
jgi:two-component system, OmpR family, copper resistance phosphate regulon response regulator CusR